MRLTKEIYDEFIFGRQNPASDSAKATIHCKGKEIFKDRTDIDPWELRYEIEHNQWHNAEKKIIDNYLAFLIHNCIKYK